MSYANEMKNLVEDIKASMKDRVKFVKDSKKDTHDLLSRFNKELKDMAKDLKDFLAKSEETRVADFKIVMNECKKAVEAIQKHTTNLLGDYAKERKEAHGYWEVLRKKERTIAEEKTEEAEKEEKKAKKHKEE